MGSEYDMTKSPRIIKDIHDMKSFNNGSSFNNKIIPKLNNENTVHPKI